jgi:predicted DNA-binding transcriptional regulator AlpA
MPTSEERQKHIAPRLFRRDRAAAYLDVSGPMFDKLVKAGILPRPKKLTPNIRAWDRRDLDCYIDELPRDGALAEDTTWND